MGEAAEMMLDGSLCEHCGAYVGEAVGYPRSCSVCRSLDLGGLQSRTAVCPQCGKRVKQKGLNQHIRDAHKEA